MADDNGDDEEHKSLLDVQEDITAILSTRTMKVSQLLRMGHGAVIALDRTFGKHIEIEANGSLPKGAF